MPIARVLLFLATLGILVVAGRSIVVGPPPIALALAMSGAYVGLVLFGVFRLHARMFADAFVEGPPGARGIVLTFDDGPDPTSTPLVLEALAAAHATATFFLIGRKAEAFPDLVREIVRRGHRVGMHSYAHDRLFALRSAKDVRRDLERGLAALEGITGERPRLFRPPIGHTNPTIARIADELDLVMVGWSHSARDGTSGTRPAAVASRMKRALRDGAILLLHDAAERGGRVPAGVQALPEVLRAAYDARLEVVTLDAWVDVTDQA